MKIFCLNCHQMFHTNKHHTEKIICVYCHKRIDNILTTRICYYIATEDDIGRGRCR